MKILVTAIVAGLISTAFSMPAKAQQFNGMIANPFAFCSLPKPCKICHPWRAIYNEICASQANAGKGTSSAPAANTPIIETTDQDGKKWYVRTVDGYTLRTSRRIDLEDASLNADRQVDGLEVIDGPSAARLTR